MNTLLLKSWESNCMSRQHLLTEALRPLNILQKQRFTWIRDPEYQSGKIQRSKNCCFSSHNLPSSFPKYPKMPFTKSFLTWSSTHKGGKHLGEYQSLSKERPCLWHGGKQLLFQPAPHPSHWSPVYFDKLLIKTCSALCTLALALQILALFVILFFVNLMRARYIWHEHNSRWGYWLKLPFKNREVGTSSSGNQTEFKHVER